MQPARSRALALVLLVSSGWSAAGEAAPTVRPWALFHHEWTVLGADAPPEGAAYWAVIQTPSGRAVATPAFLHRPYSRSRNADGHEELTPTGPPVWAARFAGSETGLHRMRLELRRDGARPEPVAGAGEALFHIEGEPAGDGFLRPHPQLSNRFQFDSGRGYFALGHNVCWVKREDGTYGFDHYFGKMSAAGENYTRVWLCTWGIRLETPSGTTDLADAWRLDHVLATAAKQGIQVKLCLENFYDFLNNWHLSPFNAQNGGPCATRRDFFASDEAKTLYRKRLRELVGRYGAYTSLMAWELWNEMDYALSRDAGSLDYTEIELAQEFLIPWTVEMAAALRDLDPNRHMVATSLGLNAVWPELWQLPAMSFAQIHIYIHYIDYMREAIERDAAAFVLAAQKRIDSFGKPAFFAEFGYMGEGEASSMNPEDPTGIALHNALWAGALSGAAGVPMVWWWDNYIEPYNLYTHYAALAKFLDGVDWNEPRQPLRWEDSGLRLLALAGKETSLLWLQNRQATWFERLRARRAPLPQQGLSLVLEHFAPGEYEIRWFDCNSGSILSVQDVAAPDGRLRLMPPVFTTDVAAKLRLVKRLP